MLFINHVIRYVILPNTPPLRSTKGGVGSTTDWMLVVAEQVGCWEGDSVEQRPRAGPFIHVC